MPLPFRLVPLFRVLGLGIVAGALSGPAIVAFGQASTVAAAPAAPEGPPIASTSASASVPQAAGSAALPAPAAAKASAAQAAGSAAIVSRAPAAASAPTAAPTAAAITAPIAASAPAPAPVASAPTGAAPASAAVTATTTASAPMAGASAPAATASAPAPAASVAASLASAPAPAAPRLVPPRPLTLSDEEAALVLDAHDALRRRDRARLAADRALAIANRNPLAPWIDYWELGNRLTEVSVPEVEAFYARWPGSYVEDRLRNDWLLELGHRRDWADLLRDYPRFRMNDDREVSCYVLLAQYLGGQQHVTDAARAAWYAQRDTDEGCALLATTLVQDHRFSDEDVWRNARLAAEFGRLRVLRFAVGLIDPGLAKPVDELVDQPARYLTRRARSRTRTQSELTTLALMRLAVADPQAAADELQQRWQHALPNDLAAAAWAVVAKQAAMKLLPDAVPYYEQASKAAHARGVEAQAWNDDVLGWQARAALRAGAGRDRWSTVLRAIEAMSAGEQRQPVWVYWKARALTALAPAGAEGDAARIEGRQMLQTLAGQLDFYGLLASDELGQRVMLPAAPPAPTLAERYAAIGNAGLQRAMLLIDLGLRSEGVREWNFTLRDMGDRELLAAAQLACERSLWDRCINSSEHTVGVIDIARRYPMPFRDQLLAQARETGIDPAYVYGLIRQESRFVMDARSYVGAAGLMQIMPGTARWTAKKLGLKFSSAMMTDREMNLRLGTGYLKLVLDDFDGSQPLAAAAYNAGPNRSRRWRDAGPSLEPAIWTENVPFNETRDYVKKVLANAAIYDALLTGQPVSLKKRLGPPIGPHDAGPLDAELP